MLDTVPVISQLAIAENTGYVISADNQLLALDLTWGEVRGILNFDSPPRRLQENLQILIGGSGEKTAVYFPSNQHLYFFDCLVCTELE